MAKVPDNNSEVYDVEDRRLTIDKISSLDIMTIIFFDAKVEIRGCQFKSYFVGCLRTHH